MSGLYASLDQTVSALNAESTAINVTGTNLANVNNPNYAREVVNLGSVGEVETNDGPESIGLTAGGITEVRSTLLDAQVRNSGASVSYYNTLQSAYQQAQAALGQTVSSTSSAGASTGLSSALSGFFNAFQSFAASPSDAGQQQAVLESANLLTDQIQTSDQNLSQVQSGLSTQVTSNVATANSLLADVASLNGKISQFEANAPGSAVSLRDQREGDLEQLASIMPVSVTESADGQDQVSTTGAGGSSVPLITNATVTGPVTVTGSTITAGSPSTALVLSGGSIQASLDASSVGIQNLRNSLNQISSQLVTSVNAAYNPSGTGNNFFSTSGTTASTISLDPSLTASNIHAGSSGNSGDNSIAVAIGNLANQTFSTAGGDQISGTFSSFYNNAVTGFGQTLSGVNDQATNATNIQTLVSNQRSTVSGVSLDDEMTNLLMYQRSYQASSQVFQTIDSLLDATINSLGTISN